MPASDSVAIGEWSNSEAGANEDSISSDHGNNSEESLNVMLPSCQDPLLAATYKNLPKIP